MLDDTFNGVKKNFGFGCMRLNLLENDTKLYDKAMNEEYISKAGECIKCGKCEHTCPQKIEIRNPLERISKL